MNLMWYEKLGFHGYSSNWKLAIVKQVMSDWPGNDRKMTLHSHFKIRNFKNFLNVTRGFYSSLAGQRQKNDATQQLQTKKF